MFRRISCLFIALALLLPASMTAQTEGKSRPFDYKMIELENGLRVVTLEDFSTPIVAFQLWYHVGSKNEEEKRHGFAHMFEHMMFQGTELLDNKDHFNFISKTGGDTNAYTAFDQTVYLANIPANQLEMVMWLEAERMGFLGIDDSAFATERKVVEEELRNGREAPYGEVAEKALAKLFEGHPYAWTPGGSIAHLRDATSYDLQKFWEKYYVPNNATLVVAGAVKHEEVQELARKYFAWIPRGADIERPNMDSFDQKESRRIEIEERNGPVPIVGIGIVTPGMAHEDVVPMELLMTILGGGESSRIYRRLVDEEKSAVQAGGASFALESAGIAGAFAVINPLGGDPEKVLQALDEELEKARESGVTAEELEKAKTQALRSEIAQLLTVSSKASALGTATVLYGDPEEANRGEEKIRKVTLADIDRVAKKYIKEEKKNYVVIKPNLLGMAFGKLMSGGKSLDDEDAPVAQSPEGALFGQGKPGLERPEWWGTEPPVKDLLDATLAFDIKKRTLPNGLKMMIIENHEVPFVTMSLGLKAGAYTEPESMPGTANMAGQLITKGTEKLGYEELTDELGEKAISLNANVTLDGGTVSASSVTDQAPRAMELLAEVVRNPVFPEEEFAKALEQARTGMKIQESTPSYIADRELRRRIYEGHPYARSAEGELKDLDKLKLDDIRKWWGTYVRPDTTVLYVAGDLTEEQAVKLAEETFGDWKAEGDTPSMDVKPLPEVKDRKIYLVDKSGANQSQIRMGHLGPGREHPMYYATRVLTEIFGGGGLDTRLNASIRVEKGLTYGAYGGFFPRRFEGQFLINTFSKTETTGEAVAAIIDEIERMQNDKATDKEMSDSRNSIIGSFAISRETPQDIVQDLWNLELNNLPEDYYDKYLKGIAETTAEDVDKAADTLIRPDKLSIVIVGDAKKVKEELEKVAEVEVVK